MDPQWLKDKLYTVAIVVSLLALVTLVINIQRRQARVEEANHAVAVEAEADIQRRRAGGGEIHARLLSALSAGPRGFVCWGDGNAAGNSRGSVTAAFADRVDDVYFAPLRGEFSRRAAMYDAGGFEIDGVNMGATNEGFYEILARTGAHRLTLGADLELPGAVERVNLSLVDGDGRPLYFAEQTRAKFGTVTVGGVEGQIYSAKAAADADHPQNFFARSTVGEARAIPAGTEVHAEGATQYRSCYPILFFGESEALTPEEFIGGLWEVVSLYGEQGRYYAVLCVTAAGSPWDGALSEAFGERYLRCDKPVGQMTARDYSALAETLLDCFQRQGAFDAVQTAVDAALEELKGLDSEP